MSADSILVGSSEKVAWCKVIGKGSFQNAPRLKAFATEMIHRGYREFVLDMKECTVMDSTFMGVLTGIAQRLMQMGHGGLHIIHLNERNRDLLQNLGLDQLFDIKPDLAVYEKPDELEPEALPSTAEEADQKEVAKIMYDAHKTLSDINPENAHKFKDVLDYLRQDLGKSDM